MADALTFGLGHLLLKALGDPDEMFWWSKRHGGQYPRDAKKNKALDITQWIMNNPRKVDDYLLEDGKPRTVDYPLEMGVPIPEWDEIQQTLTGADAKMKPLDFAPTSQTSKMPGPSIFDTPPRACVFATPNDPNTACGQCYACQGRYAFNPAQARIWSNLDRLLTQPDAMASATAFTLTPQAFLQRTRRGETPVARVKAAGDLMGEGELAMISNIFRENPDVQGWLATRQIPFVQRLLDARGWEDDAIPENLAIKVSLPGKSDFSDLSRPLRELDKHPAIDFTNYDKVSMTPGSSVCPATIPGNKQQCDMNIDPITGEAQCRACFRRGTNTTYLDHDNPSVSREELELIWQMMQGGN